MNIDYVIKNDGMVYCQNKMGNEQFPSDTLSLSWNTISHQLLASEPGRPTLVSTKNYPPLIGQRYCFESANFNPQQESSIYQLRKHNNQHLVAVYDYCFQKKSCGCTNQLYSVDVVVQRIERRLNDLKFLSPNEALYILFQSARGFGSLCRYGKICYPKQSLIGIKQNGEVKVWVNSDWSLNVFREVKVECFAVEELISLFRPFCSEKLRNLRLNDQQYKYEYLIQEMSKRLKLEIEDGRYQIQKRMIYQKQRNRQKSKQQPTVPKQRITINYTSNRSKETVTTPTTRTENYRPISCNLEGAEYQKVQFVKKSAIINPNENLQRPYYSADKAKQSQMQQRIRMCPRSCYTPPQSERINPQTHRPAEKNLNLNIELETPEPKTKKYIKFIYKNLDKETSAIEKKKKERIPTFLADKLDKEKEEEVNKGKMRRDKNRTHFLQRHVDELIQEQQILKHHEACLNMEPSMRKHLEYKHPIKIQDKKTTQKFQRIPYTPPTATGESHTHSRSSSKQMVDEFKFYLQSAESEPFYQPEDDPIEVPNEDANKQEQSIQIFDGIGFVIVQRDDQQSIGFQQ